SLLMNVPITLRERRPDGHVDKLELTVTVDPSLDTVAEVLKKVSALCEVPTGRLHLILGGSRLQPETSVQQLQLGPSTSLLALVVETKEQSIATTDIVNTPENSIKRGLSTFFVYCKNCKCVRTAKLRVHCSACDSTSIQVQREPERWSDVLRSDRIPAECFECGTQAGAIARARFVFKCKECSEPSAALQHLRPCTAAAPAASVEAGSAATTSGLTSSFCCICLSSLDQDALPPPSSSTLATSPIVDLCCGHLLCLQCFAELVKSGLKSSQFSLHPLHGYTICCPWPTCKAIVKDPHHFALAGHETYSEYKSQAVEAFVASDAVKCAHCDVAFIWESPDCDQVSPSANEEPKMIDCPHCSKQFCAVCRREPCTCENETAANRILLEATTRSCPRCDARTERNGGCAHMRCAACGADWCFVCVGPWTEECQWNHWFS
ncbi:hypothetical protein PENTCL1PPCAC_13746, partial [Pristionchus entomophagus]